MDKNTIWAIALSTLVIIAAFVLQPIFFKGKITDATPVIEETVNSETAEATTELPEVSELIGKSETVEEASVEVIPEEVITINTNLAEIKLTNKGGDIISYKLVKHIDTATKEGIQISDSVSENNRTCAIAFGPAETKIINETFNVNYDEAKKEVMFTKPVMVDGKKYIVGKRYSFKDDEYVFKLEVLIHSDDGTGMNNNGVAYTIRTAPQIGPHFNAKRDRYENRQFVTFNGSKYKKIILGQNQGLKSFDKDYLWAGIAGKYFVELVIPSASETMGSAYYTTVIEQNDYANAQALLTRKAFTGSDVSDTYYMYFGPRNDKELKRYNVAETNGWGIGGKKVSNCLQSNQMLSWLEAILKVCLEFMHKFIKNWGVCIIILTILLKLVMFPLSKKQSLSTLKMQQLQPKIQAIQAKYANDQQKQQQELSKVYQEAGYNPASGCLPMIFQFLVLFAMYNLFNNYFEFRGSMFIPGWIPDLSVGDSVFEWEKDIFLISSFTANNLRILPIIYVATQLLYGKITQYGGAAQGQNSVSMKFMTYGMPLMFFFLFYNAPSGLLLYWTVSNVFQMIQQVIINKMMEQKKAEIANGGDSNKKLPPKAKAKAKKTTAKNVSKKL